MSESMSIQQNFTFGIPNKRSLESILDKENEESRTVYVFEPSEEVSLLIKQILIENNLNVVTFKSAKLMIEKAEGYSPNIFFISVNEEEGIQAIRTLKSHDVLQPIFVVGASVFKTGLQKASEAGADFYLPKPYVLRVLGYLMHALCFIQDLSMKASNVISRDGIHLNLDCKGDIIAEIRF